MKHLTKFLILFGVLSINLIIIDNATSQPTPVLCMPFNGDALDISGNNHHGAVTGATLTTDRFGNPNSAFDFDGVDDHIEIMDTIGTMFPLNELTIVFWARTEATGNNSPILLLANDNSDRLNVHIHYDNSGTLSTFWDYGSIFNGGRLSIPNTTFQTSWEHYAFVVSESLDSMRVYKDGVLQGAKSNISSGLFNRARHLYIGGGISDVTNCHFNGQIDDVQIFNVALSETEVVNNFINANTCLNGVQNYIRGKVYYDLNSNFIQDIGEPSYSNSSMTLLNTNRICYSFPNGDYIFGIDSIGTFEVSPNTFVPYYAPLPATHTVIFSTIGEIDSLNDFALQPIGSFNDLRVIISPLTAFRPGFVNSYNIYYENVGNTFLGGDLVFYPDSLISFDSASVTPFSITSDSIIWTIAPLAPFSSGNIVVSSILQIGTINGTIINSSAKIEPIIGDANPIDNISFWEVLSTGSYDPNDIAVNKTKIDISEASNPPFLNYHIRFQNTGTDTAFTVVVENILPINLENSTFELINTSHNCVVDYDLLSRKIRFIHNNILLADSNTNESASHGYITYRIKPQSNLALGTLLQNFADIYFDFNTGVLTNIATTEITVNTTSLADGITNNIITIFPNPVLNKLIISSKSESINFIEIRDVQGKLILKYDELLNKRNEIILNIENIKQGIYYITTITDKNIYNNILLKL